MGGAGVTLAPFAFGAAMSSNNRIANDWIWFRPYRGAAGASSEVALYQDGTVYRATLDQMRKGIGIDGITLVSDKSDFPDAVSGVIYLDPGQTYLVTADVDLTGDRLEASGVVTILGTSSETASLTSTGLSAATPLITSRYTLPMRFISIKDVGTGFYIDDNGGASAPLAADWLGVNFVNVPAVGEVGTVDNFIYDTGAFLSSQGLSFTGTIGTVGINNSLFSGSGDAGNIFEIAPTCTIARRFRTIYSSVIASGSTVGYLVDASATIPVEGFILDTINFSGDGTYVSGIAFSDNRARWLENRGIDNSASISSYYMIGNATATTVSEIGAAYKISGTTTSTAITQKFTNTNNRATYDGAVRRDFKVVATLSVTSGNNNQIGIYVAKNGTVLPESETYITANVSGRAENGVVQAIVAMVSGDYVEIFVENSTAAANITATEMNVVIEALN